MKFGLLIILSLFLISIEYQLSSKNSYTNSSKLLKYHDGSTEDKIQNIASLYVNEYKTSMATFSKSKTSMVSMDCNQITKMRRFIFIEKKSICQAGDKEEFVNFRVCVPEDIHSNLPYLDVFCPFSDCLEYNEFLASNLSCLKEQISKELRNAIEIANNSYSNIN